MKFDLEKKVAILQAMFSTVAVETIREAAKKLNLEDSMSGVHEKISRAIRRKYEDEGSSIWPWVRDLFGDGSSGTVVYYADNKLYSASYTLSGDKVTLGTPARVVLAYIPAKADVSEALIPTFEENEIQESEDVEVVSDLVPIKEAALSTEGKGLLKLIAPGQGSSGYYPKDTLRKAAESKVFHAGMKMFMDHQTEAEESERPEGSLKNLMGVLESDARWEDNGPDGPGLYAPVRVYKDFVGFVNERAKDIGNSIRSMGRVRFGQVAGKATKIIEELVAAKSVDFVTTPGAGGKLVPLFESYRLESKPAATSRNSTQESNMTEAEIKAMQDQMTALQASNASLREAAVKSTAKELFADRVAVSESKLPAKAVQRVKDRVLSGTLPLTEAGNLDTAKFQTQVDAAIKDEADYLKEAAPASGGIKNMGDGGAPPPNPTTENLAEAEKTFNMSIAALAGIPIKEAK
jgi:guanyl-specific ribonuclease Sa